MERYETIHTEFYHKKRPHRSQDIDATKAPFKVSHAKKIADAINECSPN